MLASIILGKILRQHGGVSVDRGSGTRSIQRATGLRQRAKAETRRVQPRGDIPKLSCCIPTLNRSQSLARAIRSLCNQTLEPSSCEILIVDNGLKRYSQQVEALAIQ